MSSLLNSVNYVVGASEPALLRISVFLIMSHFVTPSIVLRHAISNTLSLLFDDSFNVQCLQLLSTDIVYFIQYHAQHQDLIYSELREFVYLQLTAVTNTLRHCLLYTSFLTISL